MDNGRRTGRLLRTAVCGLASITLAAGFLLVASPASAGPSDETQEGSSSGNAAVDQELLAELAAQGTAEFWVYLRESADLRAAPSFADRAERGWFVYNELTQTAESSQAGLRTMLDAAGADYEAYWIANAMKVSGDADLVRQIAARPDVAQITADRAYELPEPAPAEDEPRINAIEWGVDRIRAPQVWTEFGVRGEDIVIGSIDTGVQYNHPALVNQYRGNLGGGEFDHNYNWWDPSNICGNPSLVPCDNNGHGTHTMGTMVGDDGGQNQIGVAPGAAWMTSKGCESSSCSTGALISSGQFMLAPTDLQGENADPAKRPHVVNNSWGNNNGADPFYRSIVQAWVAAGIFPSFSNGNAGPGCQTVGSPASYPESFGVGAFDIGNNIASFSSRGPAPSAVGGQIKPQLAAPGVNVRSSLPNNNYGSLSGTSMAAPHLSGTVALMWSAAVAIERDIEATRDLLTTTAIDTSDLTCGGTPENNNVWGDGRLDAFAAVDQSPRGPTGALAGTVTDADTGEPISGATITITGPVERERVTGDDGTYSITLPVGDYSVTASAFGYADQTAQVSIAEDQTTTQNFPLEAMPSVTVSGQITDGSGHGWPMYAKVNVQGTPVSTYTNPLTGRYSLSLPMNATYTFVAESEYPGYANTTHDVAVGDGDLTVDLALVVDRCEAAPGYEFGANIAVLGDYNGLLRAFLDSRGIPSTAVTWNDDMSAYDIVVVNAPGNPGQAAFLDFLSDTDAAGTGVVLLDTWYTNGNGIWLLWQHVGNPSSRSVNYNTTIPHTFYEVTTAHPILEGFNVGDRVVFDQSSFYRMHAWFGGYANDGRQVIANAGRSDTGVVGSGIGVQERANNRHALLSMHGASPYIGPQNWTADGAAVFLNALEWVAPGATFECLKVDGGLVLGSVTDLNTGAGVDRATVSSVDNPAERGRSTTTPDDPDLGDGFYWLFSSLTGSHSFTASARNYVDVTQTVDVAADTTNEANFVLPAGQLEISPTTVEATMQLGRTAQRTFTLTNTGTAPVDVELGERRGSFEMLGEDAQQAEVRDVEGYFTPTAYPAGDAGVSTPAESGPSAEPWTNLPAYPQRIMDNGAAVADEKLYSFGGYNGSTRIPNGYVFDPATEQWDAIASMPAERMKPKVATVDGLIYIVGGWDNAGTTHSTVFVYDPASDSYSRAADMPGGRTAPGVAELDGQLYVIGGCTTSSACSPVPRTVWRYDPGSDSWETLADYPESASWLGCGGVDGQVVCTGGTDGSATSSSTYAYDPGSDTWTQVADLPYDNWAMAADAANGQLVVSGGVTNGFATITNRGAAYDPATDTWTEIEPSNNTVYRVGSACGFYKVGGSTGGFTPSTSAEVHPDFSECATTADVPWFSVSPATVTLQPGESVTATVSFDGAVDQPGTYTAGIGIGNNTPYAVEPVGVTMNITPPFDWGKITGVVTGVDCQGNAAPLAGAVVQINGAVDAFTLKTGADGTYAYWISVKNNPLQVVVSDPGHIPQARSARIIARKTIVEDFALARICGTGGGLQP